MSLTITTARLFTAHLLLLAASTSRLVGLTVVIRDNTHIDMRQCVGINKANSKLRGCLAKQLLQLGHFYAFFAPRGERAIIAVLI